MNTNVPLGVFLHAIGGLAAGSFYVPYRRVKLWAWETYWLTGGLFSWVIAPWVVAAILLPNLFGVLREAPPEALRWCYIYGMLWGIGGMMFGLTMRYLGIGLGVAIALAFCAVFGTIVPPIRHGDMATIITTVPGQIIIAGIVVAVLGIGVSGWAGYSKEQELSSEQKTAVIPEFNLVKGLVVGTLAGALSACWSFGLDAGAPIAQTAVSQGVPDYLKNLPILPIVALGGFTTNFILCIALSIRNRTSGNWAGRPTATPNSPEQATATRAPLLNNYVFCAIAGVTWYLQFFFYSIGTTKMGTYSFSSWTLHMTFIIVFSTLWGIALKEWRGVGQRTRVLVGAGLAVLLASVLIVGYGNNLKDKAEKKAKEEAAIVVPAPAGIPST